MTHIYTLNAADDRIKNALNLWKWKKNIMLSYSNNVYKGLHEVLQSKNIRPLNDQPTYTLFMDRKQAGKMDAK